MRLSRCTDLRLTVRSVGALTMTERRLYTGTQGRGTMRPQRGTVMMAATVIIISTLSHVPRHLCRLSPDSFSHSALCVCALV